MKVMSAAVVAAGVMCVPMQASAAEDGLFPSYTFTFGVQSQYMYYDEPGFIFEEGFLTGGFLNWTSYSLQDRWMVSLEAEGSKGKLHYVGQYSDGTGLECNTEDYLLGARVLIGKGYEGNGVAYTPYSGLGVRYWNDYIGVVGGYERQITQAYLPLGVNVDMAPKDGWAFGGSAELDLLAYGTVQSRLSGVGSSYNDAHNEQRFAKGVGGRISLYAERQVEDFRIGVAPFFRYWQFDNSEPDRILYGGSRSGVIEPNNEFFQTGIRLYVKL